MGWYFCGFSCCAGIEVLMPRLRLPLILYVSVTHSVISGPKRGLSRNTEAWSPRRLGRRSQRLLRPGSTGKWERGRFQAGLYTSFDVLPSWGDSGSGSPIAWKPRRGGRRMWRTSERKSPCSECLPSNAALSRPLNLLANSVITGAHSKETFSSQTDSLFIIK